MATQTDDLKRIFLAVSEDGTVTEPQEEGRSYEAVDEGVVAVTEDAAAATDDGLGDAIGGGDAAGSLAEG